MDKKSSIKEYSTEEITVVWKPYLCIHAAVCVGKLPYVYDPKGKPWIKVENASTKDLIDQIDVCPSGALSYKLKIENQTIQKTKKMEKTKVAGNSPVIVGLESGKNYAWCACGHSSNQPWCDGSHKGTGITPVVFKADESKKAAMCMCKQTGNGPFCDGSHAKII